MQFFYWLLLWPLLFVPKRKPGQGVGAPGVAIVALAAGWLVLIVVVAAVALVARRT